MCRLMTESGSSKGKTWIPERNWILKQYVSAIVVSAAIQENLVDFPLQNLTSQTGGVWALGVDRTKQSK